MFGSQVYWANAGTNTIGRANTNSTGVNQNFTATGGKSICGVAVDALSPPPPPPSPEPPSNAFRIGRPKLNKKKGTATLALTSQAAGTFTVGGRGLAHLSRVLSGPGTARVTIRAKGKRRRKLIRTGLCTVRAVISFTPDGGTPNSRVKSVRLRKR